MEVIATRAGMESRRRLAVAKVLGGWTQTDVADFLGVHPVTVNAWMRAHRAPTARPGPTPSRPSPTPAASAS